MAFSEFATVEVPRAIESDPLDAAPEPIAVARELLALALKPTAVVSAAVASVLFLPPLDPPPRATALAPVALAERPNATVPAPSAFAPAPTAVAGFSGLAVGAWALLK